MNITMNNTQTISAGGTNPNWEVEDAGYNTEDEAGEIPQNPYYNRRASHTGVTSHRRLSMGPRRVRRTTSIGMGYINTKGDPETASSASGAHRMSRRRSSASTSTISRNNKDQPRNIPRKKSKNLYVVSSSEDEREISKSPRKVKKNGSRDNEDFGFESDAVSDDSRRRRASFQVVVDHPCQKMLLQHDSSSSAEEQILPPEEVKFSAPAVVRKKSATPSNSGSSSKSTETDENTAANENLDSATNFRKSPLTLPKLTEKNLRDAWGDLEIQPPINPHESDDEQSSYGASLYTETTSRGGPWDPQKARRRASMEQSVVCIKNSRFVPAEGCYNASDFLVRCFTVRLRQGFVVLKHNRSRWSKAKHRILYLLPDGKTLSWKDAEEIHDKRAKDSHWNRRHRRQQPLIDLALCREVRHAWTTDPKHPKKTGTSTLRSRCKENLAGRSFSLIFAKRSLDFTAFSNDQCKILMEGFSALCFRLQTLYHHQSVDDVSSHASIRGASTTASLSFTASAAFTATPPDSSVYRVTPSPWGY